MQPRHKAQLSMFCCAILLAGCGGSGGGGTATKPAPEIKQNQAPVAKIVLASAAQHYQRNQAISANANASSDADNDPLSYQWTLTGPDNTRLPLPDQHKAELQFSLTQAGSYRLSLVVNDGKTASQSTSIQLQIQTEPAPVAVVTAPKQAKVGQLLLLNAMHSQSAQERLSRFLWQVKQAPTGSKAALTNADALISEFVPDVAGSYQFELTVTDNQQQQAVSTWQVQVQNATSNSAPEAIITADRQLQQPAKAIALSGRASQDPDQSQLSYQWRLLQQPAGSRAQFSAATAMDSNFTADMAGLYQIELQVTDAAQQSAVSRLDLEFSSANLPPIAQLTAAAFAQPGNKLQLSGVGSQDPEQKPISYLWQLLSKPAASTATILQQEQIQAELTPDVAGIYLLSLQVSDQELTSQPRHWLIEVPARPVAVIKAATTTLTQQQIQLDGSASTEPGQLPLQYRWSLLAGPDNSQPLRNIDQAVASFQPTQAGHYRLGLVVQNGNRISAQSQHDILVSTDLPPVINFKGSNNINGTVGDLFQPDASASQDPEQTALSFSWTLQTPAGSQARLDNALTATPTFSADVAGDYLLQLTVTDGSGQQSRGSISIKVSQPQVTIQGNVKGRLLDPDGEILVPEPGLLINGVKVPIDAQGYFSHQLHMTAGDTVSVAVLGSQMRPLKFNSAAMLEDNFQLDLATQKIPRLQQLQLTAIKGCSQYNGPMQLDLEFKLSSLPSDSLFRMDYSTSTQLDLTQLQSLTIALPASASYQLSIKQPGVMLDHSFGSGAFAASQQYQFDYLPVGQLMNTITICN